MHISEYSYQLPEELIAQYPKEDRCSSRLLHLDANTGELRDFQFREIVKLLKPNDLLVFNDTKVVPARLKGHKQSGGKIEIMVDRIKNDHYITALIKAGKSPKPGTTLFLENGVSVIVREKNDEIYLLEFVDCDNIIGLLEKIGQIPLPPYIKRPGAPSDVENYQTIFADKKGAVAAPTAGLHFTRSLISELQQRQIELTNITLHVGVGTFKPIRPGKISEHKIHKEYMNVSAKTCNRIAKTKKLGGRVIAIGTTTVRSLETAAREGQIKPYMGETDLFITPGFKFNCVDGIITNFHLPQSSLLLLVSSFSTKNQILSAYNYAIKNQYRFYSYGDAMFITKK